MPLLAATPVPFPEQVKKVAESLGLMHLMPNVAAVLKEANTMMGLEASGPLQVQANKLMSELFKLCL